MGRKKILVVDDEKKIRELLEIRLSSEGYEVIQAKDGEEGVQKAKANLPDLILMDVMMPKMDGAEATKYLQEDPATKGIPVIFLTAIVTKEEEENQTLGLQLDSGHYRFMAKPFDAQKLLAEIKKTLDNKT
ncbi:MAG: response regulator [Candidatus Omnitrophica bacterium]|nr:response regulator [Candidatus Omnitrophota bacterium]